jgi:hypothetical protein
MLVSQCRYQVQTRQVLSHSLQEPFYVKVNDWIPSWLINESRNVEDIFIDKNGGGSTLEVSYIQGKGQRRARPRQ